jgi:hypothetical protein
VARTKTTETSSITAAQLADGDLIPVIDVSDTTMSSTGTNKKLAKSQLAEAAGVTAHLADTNDAHDASAISFSATGNIVATDVQAAIAELDSEKATVAEPIAAAHIADTSDAHDASAISVLDTAGNYTATDVETVLAEIASSFARTYQSVNMVTAATYTFVAADQADIVVGNSASAQTFTVPPTSDVAATIGSRIDVVQKGAGAVSIAAGSGVTIVPAPGALATTAGVGSVCSLTLTEANTWYLSGALARTDVLFVPANEMRSARGVPSLDNYTVGTAEASPPVWLLDASSRESVIAAIIPPWGWNTARVDIWWGNTSTSSGDVVWELTYQAPVTNGDTLSASGTATNATVAAPTGTTRDVKVSTLLASVALAPGKLLAFGVSRRASDVGDTLANDAKLIGVALVRLT